MKESVTISKDYYEQLERDSALLNALKCVGVDNWRGYSDAMEMLEKESEKD